MNRKRLLIRRLAFSAVVVWLVLSSTFLLLVVAPDSRLGGILGAAAFAGADEAELERIEERYVREHGQDRPVSVRYADWMTSIPTGQWGDSFVTDEPVRGMVADSLGRTLQYLVPATLFAVVSGISLGLYGAVHPRSRGDGTGRLVSYFVLAIPNFFLGFLALQVAGDLPFGPDVWVDHIFPIVLLGTTLAGGIVSYTRAGAAEYVDTAFTKLVKAKGATEWRVAGHVLKNAAPPLFALLFGELLAAMVVGVFVIEAVFHIDGVGALVLDAVYDRDVPVLLAITYVVALVGVGGNLLQDVVAATLDPRTSE